MKNCNQIKTALLFTFLCFFCMTASAKINVSNTSRYIGANRWEWTIFIETDTKTLMQIDCVEYHLHPTFSNPVKKICNQAQTNFAFTATGWGTFSIPVYIIYKNGQIEKLNHYLKFSESHEKIKINIVPKNWSREIEKGWWEWGIFIDGSEADLNRIRCVEYTLHKTFPNPVRVICTADNRFELSSKGWGTFTVKIKVILRDGSIQELSHPLEFQ